MDRSVEAAATPAAYRSDTSELLIEQWPPVAELGVESQGLL